MQMMTMTPRDDIPTRDKPMIPTHRRVRAVVWLLAPRTSSRPAAHRDALKGRTYGRTASRPGKSHIKILARRDRSTYGITGVCSDALKLGRSLAVGKFSDAIRGPFVRADPTGPICSVQADPWDLCEKIK